MKLTTALLVPSLTLLALPAAAQTLRWKETGPHSTQSFGRSISSLADVDGDGYREILVGDPHAEPFGGLSGEVRLLSGQDGSLIYKITGATTSTRLGQDVLGIQDVNSDGVEDFIVTSDTDYPEVRSGIDGSWVRTLSVFSVPGEQVVETLADVDGDGWRELIVGHPDYGTNHGRVLLVRGSYVATGTGPASLWTREGIQTFGFLGSEVANAGDVNGDGFEDVLAGGPAEFGPGGDCGIVYMLDGTSGAVIHALTLSTSTCIGFGSQLSSAGNWDGDGFDDIVAGSVSENTGGSSSGAMRVFSGLTGALLHEVIGAPGDRVGRSVLGGIDVDGDGRDEVIYGAYTDPCTSGRGTVRVLEPLTETVQGTLCGDPDANLFGAELHAVGDVDGDGQEDFVVTDPETEPGLEANIYLFGGDCLGSIERFCASLPNSSGNLATIAASGSVSVTTNALTLIARSCPPNKPGLFFYGKTQIMNAMGDGWRCAGGMTFRIMPVVQTDSVGIVARTLDFTLPPLDAGPGAATPGGVLNFQFWFRDPGGPGGSGFNLTDGVSVRFCP